MIFSFKCLLPTVLAAAMLGASAHALPDSPEQLRATIDSQFGGDANAYVEAEYRGEYRTLGCRGRVDLMQALLDSGLVLENVSPAGLNNMLRCAYGRGHLEVFRLGLSPEALRVYENAQARSPDDASLLNRLVWDNDYAFTLALLENGTSLFDASDGAYVALTPEGHYLRVAIVAEDRNFRNVTRALQDAGYTDIVEDARRPGMKREFFRARIAWAEHIDAYNPSVLDRMIRGASDAGLADIALGVAVGGDAGALISAAGAVEAVFGDAPDEVSDSRFDFSRYLRGYTSKAGAETEREAPAPARIESETSSMLDELERLGDLRERGVISQAEFDALKDQILNSSDEEG